jgi:hypothetical protein
VPHPQDRMPRLTGLPWLDDQWQERCTPADDLSGLAAVVATAAFLLAGAMVAAATAEERRAQTTGRPEAASPASPTPATSAATATAQPTVPPASALTYEQRCGTVPPGDGAPAATAEKIAALYVGGLGVAGAGVAGCGGRAEPVRAGPGMWLAVGLCGDDIRSTGLSDGGPATMQLGVAARFVDRLAGLGELIGASSRRPAGTGDLYTVETTAGTTVLARPLVSAGPAGHAPLQGSACDPPDNQGVPLHGPASRRRRGVHRVRRRPRMVLAAACRRRHVRAEGRRAHRADRRTDRLPVPGVCVLTAPGIDRTFRGEFRVSADDLERRAPAP